MSVTLHPLVCIPQTVVTCYYYIQYYQTLKKPTALYSFGAWYSVRIGKGGICIH